MSEQVASTWWQRNRGKTFRLSVSLIIFLGLLYYFGPGMVKWAYGTLFGLNLAMELGVWLWQKLRNRRRAMFRGNT